MEDINKEENINNYKKILEYKEKLECLKKYMENKEIIQFVKEDIAEITEIQNELKSNRNARICI